MFSYGSAGIFGAHAPRGGRGGVYAGSMLSRRAATGAQGLGKLPGLWARRRPRRHKTEQHHSTQDQHTYRTKTVTHARMELLVTRLG